MKINFLISAFAAVLGTALVSAPIAVHAQAAAPASAPATSTKKVKPTSYAGTLTAIDATGNTVTVTGSKNLTLKLTAKTSYEVDKKKAALTDFAVGDKVTGSYDKEADGSLTAHSLHKKTGKLVKTAAKPAVTPTPTPAPVVK